MALLLKNIKNNCNQCKHILVSETPKKVHNFKEIKNYESVKKSLTYRLKEFSENALSMSKQKISWLSLKKKRNQLYLKARANARVLRGNDPLPLLVAMI